MLFLIIIVIGISICWYSLRNNEFFSVLASNAWHTEDKEPQLLFIKETNIIQQIFNKQYQNSQKYMEDLESFAKFPYYEKFPFENVFKTILQKEIQQLFSGSEEYTNDKITLHDTIDNLLWKDFDSQSNSNRITERRFVFNTTIINKRKAFARKIKVVISLSNISRYIDDNGNYLTFVEVEPSDVIIKHITLDDKVSFLKIRGNSNTDQFYRIKNTLYLLDPFITSRSDMVIRESMRNKFEQTTRNKFLANLDKVSTTVNENCPFYQANRNYPNTFGKLINGRCQLPMRTEGSVQFEPLCYNCKTEDTTFVGKGTLGNCCDKQYDKVKYPTLVGPDFAFNGDNDLRLKYKTELQIKNLSLD